MPYNDDWIKKVKERTDKISPTFCMAKWHHVTMYLHQGTQHSCYHCKVHPMELDGVFHHIHNTKYKKEQRNMMLDGEQPYECHYCFNVENSDPNAISDRMLRNSEKWAHPYIEETGNLEKNVDVYPKYLEVAFSNKCNLRCAYCGPGASSRWMQEIKKFGDYNIRNNQYNIDKLKIIEDEEDNIYVKFFWKYFPKMYPHLHVLRVTGGEPLLHDSFFKLLEYVKQKPNSQLEMNINSNLSISDKHMDRFLEGLGPSLERLKSFLMFASIDTWGEQAEYARDGLDLNQFEKNLYKYLNFSEKTNVSFMVTYNLYSLPNFKKLLEIILKLRKKFNKNGLQRIQFDTPYMVEPPHQTCLILGDIFNKKIDEQIDFIDKNIANDVYGFTDVEKKKLERIKTWKTAFSPYKGMEEDKADFYRFTIEHDKRRNTNFIEKFPEYEEFFKECNVLSDELNIEKLSTGPGEMVWMKKRKD